eukprot:374129-Amphidinium_carterae.1
MDSPNKNDRTSIYSYNNPEGIAYRIRALHVCSCSLQEVLDVTVWGQGINLNALEQHKWQQTRPWYEPRHPNELQELLLPQLVVVAFKVLDEVTLEFDPMHLADEMADFATTSSSRIRTMCRHLVSVQFDKEVGSGARRDDEDEESEEDMGTHLLDDEAKLEEAQLAHAWL